MATNELTYFSNGDVGSVRYEISQLDQNSKLFAIQFKHFSKQSRIVQNLSISNALIALSNDCTIKCIDINTLKVNCELKGHDNIVTDVIFSHTNPYIIWSSSLDGTIRNWDLRTATPGNIIFQSLQGEAFQSIGININDDIISAGCDSIEIDSEVRSNLYLWDTRMGSIYKIFEDTFADSIDNCIFSPISPNILLTSSIDGLIYTLDIRENEENVCLYVLNPESSVNNLAFFGDDYQFIFCGQSDGAVSLWDTETGNQVRKYPKLTVSSTGNVGTILESYYDVMSKELYTICCDDNGNIRLLNLFSDGRVYLYANLADGHKSHVTAVHWNMTHNSIISTGEDGMMLLWKPKL